MPFGRLASWLCFLVSVSVVVGSCSEPPPTGGFSIPAGGQGGFGGVGPFTGRGGFGGIDGVAGSLNSPDASAPDGGEALTTVARDDLYEVDALAPTTTVPAPGLLGNDTLAGAELIAGGSTTRLGGSIQLSADGSFVYTPPANPGPLPRVDDFSYALQTDGAEVSAIVGLVLVSQPAASDDELGVLPNDTLLLDAPGVLENDQANGARISAFDPTSTEGGLVVLEQTGALTYTPAAGFAGEDYFSYTITNIAGSATAVVHISVDEAPIATEDHYVSSKGVTFSPGELLLANDALGAPLASLVSFGGGSLGGTAGDYSAGASADVADTLLTVGADGSFTFVPEASLVGPFEFYYRIQSSGGLSEGRVVIDVYEAPLAVDDEYTALAAGSLAVTADGEDHLLANDVGTPAPVITSFGGGSLGGTVASHVAGTDVEFSGGRLRVNANGSFTYLAGPDASGEITFDYHIESAAGQDEGTVRITVSHAPEITSADTLLLLAGTAQSLPFDLTATGTPEPVITIDGVLPDGVVFANGSLTGTADIDSAGEYELTVTASNGLEPEAVQSLLITVRTPAVIIGLPSTTFAVGITNHYAPVLVGVPAPSLTLDGDLPLGLSFNDSTGVISGIAAAGEGGIYELSISANNGLAADSVLFVTLTVLEAPAITSVASSTFVVGEAGSFQVTTTGHPARSVSLTGTLPAGLSFNAATATLSGTPASGSGGSYALNVRASNTVPQAASQDLVLTVNEAPSLDGAATASFAVGASGSYALSGSGFPAPTFSVTGNLPSGLTLDTQTGILSGTPGAGTSGSYALTFGADNGIGTPASLSVTLGVDESSAITSASSTTFTVGSAGSFTVTAVGTPAPTLSVTGTLPSGVTFTPGTGVLAGTPAPGTGGTYGLTFGASNGIGNDGSQSFVLVVTEAPALIGSSTATFSVGVAGSYSVGVTGFPLSTLSLTGTLPAGLSFIPLTGVLSGTPEAGSGGSYSVSIGADNGVGIGAALSLTITVEESAEITSDDGAVFSVGTADSFTVVAIGTPAPTLDLDETLPAGLTFTAASGVLEGTPAPGSGGEYTLTFSADNGIGSLAVQTFTLTIEEEAGISGAASTTFAIGAPGSYSVVRTGFPLPSLSLIGSLPAGLSFSAATGTISGTAQAGTAGSYSVSIVASNGVGSDATLPVTLQVNEAPSITSSASTLFQVGVAGSFTVTATGTPAPTFGVSGTLPSGVTLNTNTGELSGTPAGGSGGSYALTLSANNGVGSAASQSFTLTVTQAPEISGGATASFIVGSANTYTPTATGFPAPSFSLSGSLPSGLSFSTSTGVISGTAQSGTGGSYPVTITAGNGVPSDATLSVTISVTEASVITSANATTFTVGSAGSFPVTATGTPAPTFGVSGTLPSGVTLNTSSGVLSGTPAGGSGGTYALTFSADNGVGSAGSQSFTLTVNQAPDISGAANVAFVVGTANTYTPTATGFPAPSFSLSGSLPGGLSFSTSTGVISGTAQSGSGGSYPVTITASNGVGSNDSVSVTIDVTEASVITSANATTFTVGGAGSFSVTATGTPAPTFGVTGALPSGVTLNTSSGVLSGTPAGGSGGTYALTFSADNGVGSSAASQSFTLTVLQAPSISGTPPSPVDADTAYSHSFTSSGFPAPTFSVVSGTLPTGLTLAAGTGVLSGTPTVPGTFSNITVRASNGAGTADITFSIVVNVGVPPPSATADAFSVTGNIPIDVTSSVTSNDTTNGATVTGFGPTLGSAATTAPGGTLTTNGGGSVVMASDGTFAYDPPVGASGADSFAYTLGNAGGSSTAQVSLTISNRVWFVDSAAAGGGSGKLTSPFTDLSGVSSSTSGDVIYVRRGATYSAKTLPAGQRLLGQGITVDATQLGFTLAPFSRSTAFGTAGANSVMGTLTLSNSVYVRGMSASVTGGSKGLVGSSVSSVDISGMGVTSVGGGTAVELLSTGGTVSLTSVAQTAGTNAIVITGNTGSFTVAGTSGGLRDASGGVIDGTTSDGILITNGQNITLRSLTLQNISASAVRGLGISNLTLTGLTIVNIGAGGDFDEPASANLTGVVSVTNSSFSTATGKLFAMKNVSGTISSLTFEDNFFANASPNASDFEIFDTASLTTGTIKGNTYSNAGTISPNVAIAVHVGRTSVAAMTPFARL
ncbi:MAG: hypothetical protein RL685_3306, partial [Pseudomonadota bacterium]